MKTLDAEQLHAIAKDASPNRFLKAQDWRDPRYETLRRAIDSFYRDEMGGEPHPSHAKHPEQIVTHWSREWEYPWAVINGRCEPGTRVVDLGCGGSPLLPFLSTRLGCRCAGVDLNLRTPGRTNLRGFRAPPEELYPDITWALRSMDDTGLPSESWDRVYCISVLEHVGESLAASTFREIRRLLAPDGRALITTDVDGSHRTLNISFRRLLELAREAGLVLDGHGDFHPPTNRDDHPGTYDVVGFVLRREQ